MKKSRGREKGNIYIYIKKKKRKGERKTGEERRKTGEERRETEMGRERNP